VNVNDLSVGRNIPETLRVLDAFRPANSLLQLEKARNSERILIGNPASQHRIYHAKARLRSGFAFFCLARGGGIGSLNLSR